MLKRLRLRSAMASIISNTQKRFHNHGGCQVKSEAVIQAVMDPLLVPRGKKTASRRSRYDGDATRGKLSSDI